MHAQTRRTWLYASGLYTLGGIASRLLLGLPGGILVYKAMAGLVLVCVLYELYRRQLYDYKPVYYGLRLSVLLSSGLYLYHKSPETLLFGLVILWLTDTAAMIIGRFIGGPKLAPAISPGKTIAGSVGAWGIIALGGLALGYGWVPAIVSLAGQLGDLHESLAKRHAGVKDSSALLPGHGGVYDRLDSTLVGLPMLCILVV